MMIMNDDFCEIDLSEACTLEDAKENGNDTVTEETADVGVNGHLKSKTKKILQKSDILLKKLNVETQIGKT